MVMDLQAYSLIVLVSAVCGLGAGYVMFRSDFCVTAMFRDYFLFGSALMLLNLLLLIVASMLLFELGRQFGWLDYYPFPLLGAPSLSNLIGGTVFGFGMVLAGGCVVGTLYKLGSGKVVSMAAFVGLVAGATLYAELHPWWSQLSRTMQLSTSITLAQLLDIKPAYLLWPLLTMGAVYLYLQYRRGNLSRASDAAGFLQPWKAALFISIIGFVSYLFVGMPMGITTSYSKFGAAIESLVLPTHVASSSYFNAQPLNFIPPLSDSLIAGGAGPKLDGISAIQYPLIIGIVLGSFIASVRVGEFKLSFSGRKEQYLIALVGGVIMGLGSRMTPGCNVWHLWGGIPILSLQSLLFLVGLLPGAWLGSAVLKRLLLR